MLRLREVSKAAKASKSPRSHLMKTSQRYHKDLRDKDLKRLDFFFYSKHNIVFVSLYLALYINVVHVHILSTYCTFIPRTW